MKKFLKTVGEMLQVLGVLTVGALIMWAIEQYSMPDSGGTPPLEARQSTTEGSSTLMKVTAYCPCDKCCGPYADGITASGLPVSANGGRFVAADKRYSFGTKLRVPGYGTVSVLDRGGAIKGNRLDVFFPTHEQALRWGVQFLNVEVLR